MTGTTEELTFEVGKIYLDRDGKKYQILTVDSPHIYQQIRHPLIGMNTVSGRAETYTETGCFIDDTSARSKDLVAEYKEPEYRWYNVYKDGWVNNGYRSKEACEEAAGTLRSSRIALVKVNKQTGEVFNEPLGGFSPTKRSEVVSR